MVLPGGGLIVPTPKRLFSGFSGPCGFIPQVNRFGQLETVASPWLLAGLSRRCVSRGSSPPDTEDVGGCRKLAVQSYSPAAQGTQGSENRKA